MESGCCHSPRGNPKGIQSASLRTLTLQPCRVFHGKHKIVPMAKKAWAIYCMYSNPHVGRCMMHTQLIKRFGKICSKESYLTFLNQLLSNECDLKDFFVCSTISTCRAGVSSAWRVCFGSDPSPLPLLSCLGTDSFLLSASSLAFPTKGAPTQQTLAGATQPEEINSRWVSGGGGC